MRVLVEECLVSRSRRSLRRREAGWRATGGERPVRRMTNSIRPVAVASLRERFLSSMAGFAGVCGVFFAGVRVGKAAVGERTIRVIQMPGSRIVATSVWKRPTCLCVDPLRGKTANWRAGCGRSASPVRRESDLPYQYIASFSIRLRVI